MNSMSFFYFDILNHNNIIVITFDRNDISMVVIMFPTGKISMTIKL